MIYKIFFSFGIIYEPQIPYDGNTFQKSLEFGIISLLQILVIMILKNHYHLEYFLDLKYLIVEMILENHK